MTGDGFRTHHCVLYDKVGWPSLSVRVEQHCMIYLQGLSPVYPTSLISFRTSNLHTCSQETLILNIPNISTALEKTAFQVYATQMWKNSQCVLELDLLVSLDSFKRPLFNVLQSEGNCE